VIFRFAPFQAFVMAWLTGLAVSVTRRSCADTIVVNNGINANTMAARMYTSLEW
jgi:hypothetical protein